MLKINNTFFKSVGVPVFGGLRALEWAGHQTCAASLPLEPVC